MERRWLILSNCQFQGLANCLSLIVDGLTLSAHVCDDFLKDEKTFLSNFDYYEHVIVHPQLVELAKSDVKSRPNVTVAPSVHFAGYQPDLTYVVADEAVIRGPLHDYHSAIVVTAYKLGLNEVEAIGLLGSALYQRLGYFDLWAEERDTLCRTFLDYGFDIRSDFVRWSRQGPFMYSVNHPKIAVVMDIAAAIAKKLIGSGIRATDLLPHDNLVSGPVFPVYPELAERFGAGNGSYLFKPHTGYTMMDLKTFVSGSYALYRQFRPDQLRAKGAAFEQIVKAYVEAA